VRTPGVEHRNRLQYACEGSIGPRAREAIHSDVLARRDESVRTEAPIVRPRHWQNVFRRLGAEGTALTTRGGSSWCSVLAKSDLGLLWAHLRVAREVSSAQPILTVNAVRGGAHPGDRRSEACLPSEADRSLDGGGTTPRAGHLRSRPPSNGQGSFARPSPAAWMLKARCSNVLGR
jgi:hypothetical protein